MMKSNQLSVFHHHVIDFAKQRGIPIEKALADQETAMRHSASFCRHAALDAVKKC